MMSLAPPRSPLSTHRRKDLVCKYKPHREDKIKTNNILRSTNKLHEHWQDNEFQNEHDQKQDEKEEDEEEEQKEEEEKKQEEKEAKEEKE